MDNINCYSPQAVVGIFALILKSPLLFGGITSVSSTYWPNPPGSLDDLDSAQILPKCRIPPEPSVQMHPSREFVNNPIPGQHRHVTKSKLQKVSKTASPSIEIFEAKTSEKVLRLFKIKQNVIKHLKLNNGAH